MSAPEPYENGFRVLIAGEPGKVVSHAPNADSWRYMVLPDGAPLDQAVIVSHEDIAHPPVTEDLTTRLPQSVMGILSAAGLSPERFRKEQAELAEFEAGVDAKVAMFEKGAEPRTPLQEFLDVVAADIRSGLASPNVAAAFRFYREATR